MSSRPRPSPDPIEAPLADLGAGVEDPVVTMEEFEVPAWRGLLPPRLSALLQAAVQAALRDGTGDEGVMGRIRELSLSEGDQVLLRMAWRLWRGWGPVIEVQHLQGIDPEVLIRVLMGLSLSGAPEQAAATLAEAAARLEAGTPIAEEEPTGSLARWRRLSGGTARTKRS
jgi:hypothetical protein